MPEENGGEKSGQPIDERDFIHESYQKDPAPPWIWLAVIAAIVSLILGSVNWVKQEIDDSIKNSPFMRVTNRQMSLFLWHFPEYMRIHVKAKEGYLTGFHYQEGKVSLVVSEADQIASAPPELLFLYHTWARLLKGEVITRAIPLPLFKEFIQEVPEWSPKNWKEAPQGYKDLISGLDEISPITFVSVSRTLPVDVQIAVTGWRNYYKEGNEIDKYSPTFEEVRKFLEESPNYARNYWRNILIKTKPYYLISFLKGEYNPKAFIPQVELAGFLKVALYNQLQANKESPDAV